mgnify:CR=1 FL=1
MKRLLLIASSSSAMLMAIFQAGCCPTPDLEAERLVLLQTDRDCATAASTNDLETLWTFWDEDSLMLMSADFSIHGIDEFKPFALRSREDPNFSINWEVEGCEVAASGDFGYTYGIGTVTRSGSDGQPITSKQPYLTVWRKHADGSWRTHVEK